MVKINYRLATDYGNCNYDPRTREIEIDLQSMSDYHKLLSEEEFIAFLNSMIEHESIHAIIHKHIGLKESVLFDIIAKKYRIISNPSLRRIIKKAGICFYTKRELKNRATGILSCYGI